MSQELQGINIAILLTDGFEQVEMTQPRQAFNDVGASTYLISPGGEQVQGWNHYDQGDRFILQPKNQTSICLEDIKKIGLKL